MPQENPLIVSQGPALLLSNKVRYLPYVVAAVVLCAAAWLAFLELPAQQAANDAATGKLRSLETFLRTQAAATAALPQNLPSQLAGFDALTQVTADLQALAAQNGLVLSDATFKPAANAQTDTKIGRVEVAARLKGAYVPLKKTLGAMFAAHPGLALESLSMRRGRAGDVVVDVDLRLTYFYLP